MHTAIEQPLYFVMWCGDREVWIIIVLDLDLAGLWVLAAVGIRFVRLWLQLGHGNHWMNLHCGRKF